MANFYVGNLQWETTEDELKEFFSTVGKVSSAQIVKDIDTGRSRGFGFVVVDNVETAAVISAMNGKELRGRSLKINEAKERESRKDSYRNDRNESYSRRSF